MKRILMFTKSRFSPRFAPAWLAALLIILPAVAAPSTVEAAQKRTTRVIRPIQPAAEKDAAIVVDGATGKVLYSRNPDAIRYPASLTKMMTLYLLFGALEKGTISLDTPLITSVHASEQEPTKLSMGPGASIPVDTAIKALTVLSANDVAVVIAESLGGGSEETFATMMTETAHELGMTHTNFHNASGLPDLLQLTTARDMSILARHLAYDFPQYYHYFSVPGFTYAGRSYASHDNLLRAFAGTDGIKTGYTQLSGFNLVTSAVRDNKHLIGVVLGGPTAAVRDREMMHLLATAFNVVDDNPTLVADANVPWQGGKGPAGPLFRNNPGEDASLMLAALEAKPKSRLKAKTTTPVLMASAKVPAEKSVLTTSVQGQMVIVSPETQTASAVAEPARETGLIEPLRQDPTKMPPLRLGPAIALQTAANAAPIAQGDGDTSADAPELSNPLPVVAVSELPVPPAAAPLRPVAVPAANPILAFAAPLPTYGGTVKRWAIQVGAFASEALAQAKLTAFVKRGFDVVGQAQKLVVPFASGDGRILYRARLGMFAENEARDICKRMVQRGQACLAAPADAG
jgi:D-alanyl-D-alanine carboxypeptidase